jgi:hypothetical protein
MTIHTFIHRCGVPAVCFRAQQCAAAVTRTNARDRWVTGVRIAWSRTESNRRHLPCKDSALPTELRPREAPTVPLPKLTSSSTPLASGCTRG